MLEGNSELSAEMSKSLAEIAVDLESFRNARAKGIDTSRAIRAAITGETESIKRLGIVMLDSTLEIFRMNNGFKKSFKSMNIAEKTILRHAFIVEKAKDAQGDAAKTADFWANATIGLHDALVDLGTEMGKKLLPEAEKLLLPVRDAIRWFEEWQKTTLLLKASFIVLGVVAAAVATGMLISWLPVIAPFLLLALAIGVAAFLLDDFLVFMKGGKSVLGDFIDSLLGPGSATEAVKALEGAWADIVLFWKEAVITSIDDLRGAVKLLTDDWGTFFDKFGEWVIENEAKFLAFSKTVKDGLNAIDIFGLGELFSQDEHRDRDRQGNLLSDGPRTNTGQGFGTGTAPLGKPRQRFNTQYIPGGNFSPGDPTITNNLTVDVHGNASANDAAKIAAAAGAELRKANRKTKAALQQWGGGGGDPTTDF